MKSITTTKENRTQTRMQMSSTTMTSLSSAPTCLHQANARQPQKTCFERTLYKSPTGALFELNRIVGELYSRVAKASCCNWALWHLPQRARSAPEQIDYSKFFPLSHRRRGHAAMPEMIQSVCPNDMYGALVTKRVTVKHEIGASSCNRAKLLKVISIIPLTAFV